MQIEPVELFGRTGRDFVIYGDDGLEQFSARLFDDHPTLEILWTDDVPRTLLRLRDAQQAAGGEGAFDTIVGQASFMLREMIVADRLDRDHVAKLLGRALGGTWRVDVISRPGSIPPTFDIAATRQKDAS